MDSGTQAFLQSWSAPIGVIAALSLAALIYARGWFRLRTVVPSQFSAWRLVAFDIGIIAVLVAVASPLSALDDVSLSVHMVQHLLLMAIAPPLILLGAPQIPLLQGLPQTIRRTIFCTFLPLRILSRLGHFLTHPAFCWFAAATALVGWHIPNIFELALKLDWLHELEHASFLVTGLLFWWPVVQPWPSTLRWQRWSIPLYLFCATLPCDVLSGFLTFCDRVVYPSYLSAPRLFGMSPLQDQECAAALMWVCVTVIFLVPAVVVTLGILSPQRADLRPGSSFLQETTSGALGSSKLEVI